MPWIPAAIYGASALGAAAMSTYGGKGGDVQQYPTLTKRQKIVSGKLGNFLASETGGGATPYNKQMTAPLSSYEQGGLKLLGDYTGGKTPAFRWGQAGLKSALSGAPSTTINPETSEQFYQSAVKAPALKEFSEDVLPQIRESNNRGGFVWGTARQKAENDAYADLMDTLTTRRSEISYADEEARRGLAESAAQRQVSALPQALQYAEAPISAAMGYGATPRLVEQAGLEAKQSEWMRTRPEYNPTIPAALSYIGEPMMGMYQTPTTPSALGPMSQLATAYLLNRGQGTDPLNWSAGTTPASGNSGNYYMQTGNMTA
jgi:hypothetical protein